MMKTLKTVALLAISIVFLASCDNEGDETKIGNLMLEISGLADLGSDYTYEGWIMVDGAPVTTGTFNVDANGNLSKTAFTLSTEQAEKASAFILTIEPFPDTDPAPSKVHIIAGDISGNKGSLSVSHGAALGTDFESSTGKYILATPTNGADNDEKSGVWFIDPSSGAAMAGLNLPTLPEGWEYEGWAVINGTPVTTGKFTALNEADASAPYSGSIAGPPFPGEDFLVNAPEDQTFPTDLAGTKIVISVEPMPDNSSAPFLLKPLLGDVPTDALDHTPYELANIAKDTNPAGSVSLSIK